MPRNASGIYTLPNPDVVTDTTILSDDENDTRNDIEAELTNSLSRSGQGGMLAALKITDGTVSNPGIAFSADLDNGFYRTGTDNWSLTAGGNEMLRLQGALGLTLTNNFNIAETTPAALAADQNNWTAAASGASYLRASATGASRNVTGLANGAAGRVITIHNIGSFPIVFKNEDATSTAANRFQLRQDYVLQPLVAITLQYDGTSSRWRLFGSGNEVPPGVILDFGGTTAPPGFLACDGSAVSRTAFAALFAAISTTWGVGDGATTFNVPNLQRRVTMGSGGVQVSGPANTVGSTGGAETHTLALSETPAHSHGAATGGQSVDHTHSGTTGTDSVDHTHSGTTTSDGAHTHSILESDGGTLFNRPGGNTNNILEGASDPATLNTPLVTGSAGAHQHTMTTGGISAAHTHTVTTGGVSVGHTHSISADGGGGAHNNVQPTAVVSKIIKF